MVMDKALETKKIRRIIAIQADNHVEQILEVHIEGKVTDIRYVSEINI